MLSSRGLVVLLAIAVTVNGMFIAFMDPTTYCIQDIFIYSYPWS